MARNNEVKLIGNMGAEARINKKGGKLMAAFPLATQDSYRDDDGNWVKKDPVWHNILVFRPVNVQKVKSLKKGTRIKLTGPLSYRDFKVIISEGTEVIKKEASVIADTIELDPLTPK